jgi:hypothetical protein
MYLLLYYTNMMGTKMMFQDPFLSCHFVYFVQFNPCAPSATSSVINTGRYVIIRQSMSNMHKGLGNSDVLTQDISSVKFQTGVLT